MKGRNVLVIIGTGGMKGIAVARQVQLAVSAGVAQVPAGSNPFVRAGFSEPEVECGMTLSFFQPVLRGVR